MGGKNSNPNGQLGDVWYAEIENTGPPVLGEVRDRGDGSLNLEWTNESREPVRFLGFAYDVYSGQWVEGGEDGSLWFPFDASASSGTLTLGGDAALSGAYFVWVANQYNDGGFKPCENPATVFLTGGFPHAPLEVEAESLGERRVRLAWKPEPFGTWLYWIIAYHVDSGEYVATVGPRGEGLWHYVTAADAEFLDGATELAVPSAGEYWFFIGAVAWDDPAVVSDFTPAYVVVP